MRLTCPNCDAQYEVDDTAIPEGGRDVQCSNCGHAWFQLPAGVEEDLHDEAHNFGDSAKEAPEPVEEPEAAQEPEAETEAAQEPEAELAPEPEPEGLPEPEAEPEPQPEIETPAEAAAPRRPLNDDVKSLLREEAQREIDARRTEGAGLETQPDLGLTEAPAAASLSSGTVPAEEEVDEETRRKVAEMMSEGTIPDEDDETASADAGAAPRRDLLPDIEEINSTLRATSERAGDEPGASADAETPAERRGGFRRGFLTVLLLAVVLVMLYLYAPMIAQKAPAAAGPLKTYVQTVDKGRLWLDGLMERATKAIQAENGSAGN